MNHVEFQRTVCAALPRPLVNIGCKEDPARLGRDFGAVNVDVLAYDPHTRTDLRLVPNFVQADGRDLPFDGGWFGAAVLSEVIEHCRAAAALALLGEARRVIRSDGRIVLTFPLDARPKIGQHPAHLLVEWCGAEITSWHQTVWDDRALAALVAAAGLVELARQPLAYPHCPGWGVVLARA